MYSYVAPPALATLHVSFNLLGVILTYQVYEQTGCVCVYACAYAYVCVHARLCLCLCRRDAAKNCMYSYVAPPALATLHVSFNLLGVILIYQVYEQTGCVCALVHMHM